MRTACRSPWPGCVTMTATKADSDPRAPEPGALGPSLLCPACRPAGLEAARDGYTDDGKADDGKTSDGKSSDGKTVSRSAEPGSRRWLGSVDFGTIAERSSVASLLISGLGLAVLPKCPLCLAGYSTVFAMLGLSASTLGIWRGLLGAVLLTASVFLLIRLVLLQLATESPKAVD